MIGRKVFIFLFLFLTCYALISGTKLLYSQSNDFDDIFTEETTIINAKDIILFSTLWQQSVDIGSTGDFNQDGIIDHEDLIQLITHKTKPSITPTSTNSNSTSPTSTPIITPTATLPENQNSPTPADNVNPSQTPVPTKSPTPGSPNEPQQFQPEFVRIWHKNPHISLFDEPVQLPDKNGIASSEIGYAVITQDMEDETKFISFDQQGRIFNVNLPITSADYSQVSLVDGLNSFGKFFDSPAKTKRFFYEAFNMESPISDTLAVQHLSALDSAWTFAGGPYGSAMIVFQQSTFDEDKVILHYIEANDQSSMHELVSAEPLPQTPEYIITKISQNYFALIYPSENSNSIFIWLIDRSGNLVWNKPVNLPENLMIKTIALDDQENFYFITQSNFGPRFYTMDENGVKFIKILEIEFIKSMVWHDGLLWLINPDNHSMTGITTEGDHHTGPVDLFPTGWQSGLEWLQLKNSGTDLGAFFTDAETQQSIHYMQIEAGPMVTPTPLPASGIPTGATTAIDLGNDIFIEMVLIPDGTFQMGSPDNEQGRRSNEGPQHSVTITEDFFMSRYEITNAQFRQFNPRHPNTLFAGNEYEGDDLPATSVTWQQANEFCEWLSDISDFTFALPTEAQWEYAARAGTTTSRYWIESASPCAYANAADITAASEFVDLFENTTVFQCRDGYTGPSPVGTYEPNNFGLFDMLGNSWEWTADWFSPQYPLTAQVDPTGPATGFSKVIRGGSWRDSPNTIRSAFREGFNPENTFVGVGFRVVIVNQ